MINDYGGGYKKIRELGRVVADAENISPFTPEPKCCLLCFLIQTSSNDIIRSTGVCKHLIDRKFFKAFLNFSTDVSIFTFLKVSHRRLCSPGLLDALELLTYK